MCRRLRRSMVAESVTARDRVLVAGLLHGERLVVPRGRAEGLGRRFQVAWVGELQLDVPAGDAALELLGAAVGHDPAVVEDRDAVGEVIRLVQVLRGEEDRDATG